jgi:hypothetical protein
LGIDLEIQYRKRLDTVTLSAGNRRVESVGKAVHPRTVAGAGKFSAKHEHFYPSLKTLKTHEATKLALDA